MRANGSKPVIVTMLGGFSMKVGTHQITEENNRSQKMWSVLCYLLIHRDRPVLQSELIEQFWGDTQGNPASALKTLIYRLRAVLEPLFPGDWQPIISTRGGYSWNPGISCVVDAEEFEARCRNARQDGLSNEECINAYLAATRQYQGDFLPKMNDQLWVVPLQVRYHGIYVEAVKRCADLLHEADRTEEEEKLCRQASQLEFLDEGIYIRLIRALIEEAKDAEAQSIYDTITDRLYRSLGVRPSEELQKLHKDLMERRSGLETDLEVIQAQLKESAMRPGAFFCEYGIFQEVYRLESRRVARNGISVHVALVTLATPAGGMPPLAMLNDSMDKLRDILVGKLRRGDVVARYSGSQYVVLLPSANFENSNMVMERVASAFRKTTHMLRLAYKVQALEE